jgi:hypothetical protein
VVDGQFRRLHITGQYQKVTNASRNDELVDDQGLSRRTQSSSGELTAGPNQRADSGTLGQLADCMRSVRIYARGKHDGPVEEWRQSWLPLRAC